ncbi:hypothetical protein AB205_0190920 [Aquarana catesbeiana]|uniref:Extracellular Endonuclease subunit A domain-containing protein n=1 Tax=Aquarana catesbeiana TaxID=8400 RepID=A0A2G9S9G3_AQUCT|nr:hypothetical protein AB205_0190920 [Aquarana catesbeiana]
MFPFTPHEGNTLVCINIQLIDDVHYSNMQWSAQVIKALMDVDRIVGMLMDGLKQMQLDKCVNLLLLSDHGMEESRCENIAYLGSYLNTSEDYICRNKNQHFKPFLKQDLPKRLHFAKNDRIETLNFYCDPKWQVAKSKNEVSKFCNGGFHGSDNLFKNMQALFIAYGPKFKYNTEVQPFENIEIYNLMCDLLGIEPAANNGSRGSLNHLLKNPVYEPSLPKELSEPFQCSINHSALGNTFGCSCNLPSLAEAGFKAHLSLTPEQESDTKRLNLPFGRPVVLQNSNYCILYQDKYVSGYSYNIKMPLWSSYTIGKNNHWVPKGSGILTAQSEPSPPDCRVAIAIYLGGLCPFLKPGCYNILVSLI